MLSGDSMNSIPIPRLEGKNVNLVGLNMNHHLLPLWEAQTKYKETLGIEEDLIFKYTTEGPHSFEDYQKYLLRILSYDDFCPFVIEYKYEGHLVIVGAICYMTIVPEHRKCELGHLWLDPRYRRRNIMDEAIYLLFKHAFEVAKYRRVQWQCHNENESSKKLALRNMV